MVAWGSNNGGQCDVPPPNTGFVAIAGGWFHSVGLKADGSIVAWGDNSYRQCSVPAPNSGFIGVAGGQSHTVGLKAGGCPGNLNGDRVVNIIDLTILLVHFGTASGGTLSEGDLDCDGSISLSDLAILLAHFGDACP